MHTILKQAISLTFTVTIIPTNLKYYIVQDYNNEYLPRRQQSLLLVEITRSIKRCQFQRHILHYDKSIHKSFWHLQGDVVQDNTGVSSLISTVLY